MARVTRAVAHLSAEEVKHRLMHDPRSWCRQRWLLIYHALVDPCQAEDIAKQCGVSTAMVHQVISTYNRQGVEAVETPGRGGRRHVYLRREEEERFLAPFFARAERGEIATVAEIQRAFEAQIGREVDDSTIYRLLHRHGWRKLMPRPRHPQATIEAQEQLKKTFQHRQKQPLPPVQEKMSGQSSLWHKTPVRFGRISRPKRCWSPPGIRPIAPAQVVRESMYVFAAVAPSLGRLSALVLPSANTAMMNLFLDQVSQTFADFFIVMQVDQAGWHRSNELVIPANIRLIQQPAYSPEVNPVEHLWEELREKYFHNRIFPSLDLLVDELCRGLNELADDQARITSMMSFPHLNVSV